MVFSEKWLQNHPQFLLHFLIHIDVLMLHNSLIISFFAPFSLLQIFTESLICSGSIDNISLATEALTVMFGSSQVSPSPPPSPSFSHILPYQLSLDVAVKAAQEYFNSAAGPRDPEIELTRYNSSIIIKNGKLYSTQLTHPPNYCTSTWLQ